MRIQTKWMWSAALAMGVLAVGFPASAQNKLGHVEELHQLLGKEVISSDNQPVGKLNNLIVDVESGRILYAVVGSSKGNVAVVPNILTRSGNGLKADVKKQAIETSPQFTSAMDKPGATGNAAFVAQVYQHYGVKPWWQGAGPADVGSFHNTHRASNMLGMKVDDINNHTIGTVGELGLDIRDGRLVYVFLHPDPSLNLGNNVYALPPEALTWNTQTKTLGSNLSKEKLASAPHFPKNQTPNLSDPTFASQVYQYYGKQAYFQTGGAMQPTGR